MPQQVQGVIARAKDAPVELVTINVPDPGPGEAVVQVQACGVCHTDLHYVQGGIGDDYPYLLGHEAAGIVEAVGDGVTDVAPGDYVILNWRAVCGSCRACRRGRPWYCFATHNAQQKMTLADGTVLSPALGIGAFIDKTLVAAGQCTKVDPAAAPEVAGLLGCGVMAGLGAVLEGHLLGGVEGGEAVPGPATLAGPAAAADGSPVQDHVVAGRQVAYALTDRLDDAGGLVAEQVRVVVADAALDIVQVGVADTAGLDLDHRLARSGIGNGDGHQLDGCVLGARDDSLDLLRHVVLLVGAGRGSPPGVAVGALHRSESRRERPRSGGRR